MKKANRLPPAPSGVKALSYETAREYFKAKFVPREPNEDEELFLIQRPQVEGEFFEYRAGDLIRDYVCVAAKPGFTTRRAGSDWKRWEQLIVVRRATSEDHVAVAEQRAAQDAEIRRSLERMNES